MDLIRPDRLRSGDRIAVVSPSWGGPHAYPHRFDTGLSVMRDLGLVPVEMPHCRADPAWLRAHPAARAADLMAAFADPEIRGIWASIGGDDSLRLLPHLDLSVLTRNPKVFIGFSDTTVLHFACLRAGVSSFYGPSVMAGLAENGGMHALTRQRLAVLFDPAPMGEMPRNSDGVATEFVDWGDIARQAQPRKVMPAGPPELLQRGVGPVEGPLLGGCIEVLAMLLGTPLWPPAAQWDGAVVFLETSEENPSPDQVARWLRSMGAQGIWRHAAGVLLARPESADPDYAAALHAAVIEELSHWGGTGLPVLAGLDFGHTQPMMTLPYGRMCRIDPDRASWALCEGAVQ